MASSNMSPEQKIIDLLHKERNMLSQGDLDSIADLGKAKENLLEEMIKNIKHADRVKLEEMKEFARGNLDLISAAQRGIENVRKRLEDLNRLTSGSHTYGNDGHRNSWPSSNPTRDVSY